MEKAAKYTLTDTIFLVLHLIKVEMLIVFETNFLTVSDFSRIMLAIDVSAWINQIGSTVTGLDASFVT